jgi:hypothetical protein
VTIVGVLSNPQLRVDELGPPEFRSNERFEKPRTVRLTLPAEMYACDVRAAKPLGRKKDISLMLDPYEPAIFAFSPEPIDKLRVAAPASIRRGETGNIGLSVGSPAAVHVFHVEVLNPSGKVAAHYSGNVLARDGAAAELLPIAYNDPAGKWTVLVKDLLSGQENSVAIDVR